MATNLPTDIAANYPDRSGGDKAHQQHHDSVHGAVNELTATVETGRLSEGALNNAFARGVSVTDSRFGAVGDGATDDLPAFQAALAELGVMGGTLYVPAGRYLLSDSLNIDAEWIKVECDPEALIEMTSTTSSGGHAVGFIGHVGQGTATTPQREYAEWVGGRIKTSLAGTNENALGAVRYKRVRVSNLVVEQAGRKAFTAQYGVDDVQVDGLWIGQTGNAAVSIEEACNFVGLRGITVEDAGRWAFYVVNTSEVEIERTIVKSAGDRAYYFSGCRAVTVDRFTVEAATAHAVEVQGGTGIYNFSRFAISGLSSGQQGFVVVDNAGEVTIEHGTVTDAPFCSINSSTLKRAHLHDVTYRNVPAGADVFTFVALPVRPTLAFCKGEGAAHRYTMNALSMNGTEAVIVGSSLTAGASGKYTGWKPKTDVAVSGIDLTATKTFGAIGAGATAEVTFTTPGAVVGDTVTAVPRTALPVESGLVWSAYVSTTDVVTLRVANVSGAAITPASRQWRVNVLGAAG